MLDGGYCYYNNVFMWKNNEIWRKNPNKICKNGDFRHISGIFGWKKFFLIIRLGHVLSIVNTHLCAQNEKKLMIKSQENAKKNRALSHFKQYHFASVCKILWKKIKYSSRYSRNISGKNWLFRRFLDSSGFKNKFFW